MPNPVKNPPKIIRNSPKVAFQINKLYICIVISMNMGQLAFLKIFLLVSIPTDVNDNRRHVHVFKRNTRHMRSLAKIWIEKNGEQCVEIADSELTSKENEMLVNAIDKNWEYINEQISKAFKGEKTKVRELK